MSETRTQLTGLPEYVAPYYEWMMKSAQALAGESSMPRYEDAAGNPIQRIADFNDDQLAAMQGIRALASTPNVDIESARNAFGAAGQIASQVANYQPGRLDLNYSPTSVAATQFSSDYKGPADFQARQSGIRFDPASYTPTHLSSGYEARAAYNPYTGYAPTSYRGGYEIAPVYDAYTGEGFERISAERGETPFLFDTATADAYMSPYMQRVVEVQKEAARRDFDRDRARRGALAVQAGAFGGSRQAVQEALADESLMRRMGEIQALGTQAAFENAQQQAERDRNSILGVQAMNIGNRLRADMSNQAASQTATALSEQSRQFGAGLSEQQRRFLSEQALREQQLGDDSRRFAAGMGEQQAQFGANFREGQNRFGSQLDLQAQTANEAARLAGAQFVDQSRLASSRVGLEAFAADEASRQFAAQFGDQGRRFAAEQALRAAQASDASRLAAAQFEEQSRMNAANVASNAFAANENARAAAANMAMNAAGALGATGSNFANLGSLNNTLNMSNMNALAQIGQQQQAQDQTKLNLGYQDFLTQSAFPRENLNFFSSVMRGIPVQNQQQTFGTTPQPSALSGVFGAGLGGLALSNMLSR